MTFFFTLHLPFNHRDFAAILTVLITLVNYARLGITVIRLCHPAVKRPLRFDTQVLIIPDNNMIAETSSEE